MYLATWMTTGSSKYVNGVLYSKLHAAKQILHDKVDFVLTCNAQALSPLALDRVKY